MACALALAACAPATQVVTPAPTSPASPASPASDVTDVFNQGVALADQGLVEPAIVAFQTVLARDPSNVPARVELAKITLRTRNWSYAAKILSELSVLQPNDTELLRLLLDFYEAYAMVPEALHVGRQLLVFRTEDTALLERLARLYADQNLIDEEIATYERLAALRPTDPAPLWRLAALYADQARRPKDERRTYERLRALAPDDPAILRRLARVYGEHGLYEEQSALYELLRRRDPEEPLFRLAAARARQELGRTAEDEGRYARAVEDYRRALTDDPDLTLATRGLERALELRRPEAGYEFLQERYRLEHGIVRTSHHGFGLVAIPGFDATLRLDNVTRDIETGRDFALTNETVLRWQQMPARDWRLTAAAGALAVVEARAADRRFTDGQPIVEAGLTWSRASLVTLSGVVKQEPILDSPTALAHTLSRAAFEGEGIVTPNLFGRPLSVATQGTLARYSDGNAARIVAAIVEYPVLFGKAPTLEDPGAVPADERSRPRYKLALGYRFDDIHFDRARTFYSSVRSEQINTGTVDASVRVWTRTYLSASARFGVDQAGAKIRYYVGELTTRWLESLNAFARFETGDTTVRRGTPTHEQKVNVGISHRF